MRRFITFTCIAIIGILTAGAQDLQNEQMRTTLNTNLTAYHTLCEKLLEHIEAIQKSSASLSEKSKDNEKIKALIKELNKRIPTIYENTQRLDRKIAELSDSLNTPNSQAIPKGEENVSPNQPPVEIARDSEGQFPVEGVQDPRLPQEVVQPAPKPVSRKEAVEQYLYFSLSELSTRGVLDKKRREVLEQLNTDSKKELYDAYVVIFDLLSVQYELYNRIRVKEIIQKASSVHKEILVGNHYDELQSEIEHVKEYRYATMELQRLINIVSNPSSDIKKELGYESSGSSDNKWAESEEVDIPSSEIRDYLNNKNETEYINKFDYTRKKFDEFVENPERRGSISREINDALK